MLNESETMNYQPYVKPTDQLMKQVAEGDADAFARLYYCTQSAVYSLLLSLVKNPATAEDLMQDTYLSVQHSIQSYVPQGKPMAWIFTIAKNLAFQELRRQKKQTWEEYDENETLESGDDIGQAIDNIILRTALQVLDEKERRIVLLHVASGMKFIEIASATGTPLGTVLSSYHRAMRKLNKNVKGDDTVR